MGSENWNFVADITHHGLTSSSPVGPIVEYVRRLGVQTNSATASGIVWLARPDQRASLPNNSETKVEECSAKLSPKALLERIEALFPNGSSLGSLVLFSYDREGLATVTQSFARAAVIPVGIASLPGLITAPQSKPAELGLQTPVGRAQPPFTFGDALSLAKLVLEKKRAYTPGTAMRLTQFRLAMIGENPRAIKDETDPVSKSLISLILRDGEEKDWLRVDRSQGSGREFVYLSHAAKPVPVITSPAITVAAETAAPPSTPALPEKERARDRVMIDALCAKGIAMWTPGELRELLCEAVGSAIEAIRGKSTINVQIMIETAVASARQKAEAAGYPYSVKWDSTGQCFLRNLIAAEVLIDDKKNVIRNHWTAGAKSVSDLADDWTLKVEGALVLAVLRNVPKVSLSDEFSLALALYQRGQNRGIKTTELHTKIAIIIEFLEQMSAIVIDGENLVIAPPKVLASHQ